MLFDTHIHLNDPCFDADREELMAALPEKGLEKINVRIDGKQLMEAPNGYVEVIFDDLEVFIYWSKGQPQVGARATGIYLADGDTDT